MAVTPRSSGPRTSSPVSLSMARGTRRVPGSSPSLSSLSLIKVPDLLLLVMNVQGALGKGGKTGAGQSLYQVEA